MDESKSKERKWGWGWYIVVGLIFTSVNRYYKGYGSIGGIEIVSILALASLPISLLIYFYLRNRVLREKYNQKLRSTYSGIISYIFTILFIALLSSILTNIKTSESQQISDGEINKFIALQDSLGVALSIYVESNSNFEANYNLNPSTNNEVYNNLSLINEIITMHKSGDSLILSNYQAIHRFLKDREENNEYWEQTFPINSGLYQDVIKQWIEFSENQEQELLTLKKYYEATINSEPEADELWQQYREIESKTLNARKDYLMQLSKIDSIAQAYF